MKFRRSAATAAMAATGTYGQAAYGGSSSSSSSAMSMSATPVASSSAVLTSSPSTTYETVTYSDCSSNSMSSLITVTSGFTITYCPECEMMTSASDYTTVYTTVYQSLCPTGLVPATYTVTESCTGATPTWTQGPSHIPNGFTVTTKECTVCDTTPTAVTITEPCTCEATNGVPVTNTASTTGGQETTPATATGTGASGTSPASPSCTDSECGGNGSQNPASPSCTGSECGGSGTQSGASPSCTDSECGGSGNQSGSSPTPAPAGSASPLPPYPTTATCPGPQCRAVATGSYPSGVNYGNTSGIVPSTGEGSSSFSSVSALTSMFLAVTVAALAFIL